MRKVFPVSLILLAMAAAPARGADEAGPRRSVEAYEEQIAGFQAEGGALDPRIAESLLVVAAIHSNAGRYSEAAAALRQALHIRRVNEGLHRMEHADIVEAIIEHDTLLGDMEALDRDYTFLYWLYLRNFGDDDPRLVPVIDRIARWRLDAYRAANRGGGLSHLFRADKLNDKALDILEPRAGELRDRYLRSLYRSAVINYYIAYDAQDSLVSFTELRGATMGTERSIFERDELQARQRMIDSSFFKGQRAVRKALELTEAGRAQDPVAYARALVFQGDWYSVFKRRWSARGRYEEAWRVLVEGGAGQEVFKELFGEPVRLEPLSVPGEEVLPPVAGRAWAEARIDVPDSGNPRNVRITATSSPGGGLDTRAAWALRGILYRPRYENGEPVSTSDVPVRYYFER